MQSRRVLTTWRLRTVGVVVKRNLEDPIDRPWSIELGRSTTVGRPKWTETQRRDASHRCRSTRNCTALSCFSSRRFHPGGIPYVGDSSSGDDSAANSRANFLHPGGNDAEQKGINYLEA